jgi:DNA-binding MarR family transcriptional regulator
VQTEEKTFIAEELARAISKFRKFSLAEKMYPDINFSEYKLLRAIRNFMKLHPGGIKVSELSKDLQVTPARATHMINPLEKEGFIERFSHSGDRRIVLVKPTAKGIEITEKIEEGMLKKFAGLVNHLGEDDSRKLIDLLTRTQDFFDERNYYGKHNIQ